MRPIKQYIAEGKLFQNERGQWCRLCKCGNVCEYNNSNNLKKSKYSAVTAIFHNKGCHKCPLANGDMSNGTRTYVQAIKLVPAKTEITYDSSTKVFSFKCCGEIVTRKVLEDKWTLRFDCSLCRSEIVFTFNIPGAGIGEELKTIIPNL